MGGLNRMIPRSRCC